VAHTLTRSLMYGLIRRAYALRAVHARHSRGSGRR
jgi:hypothetical protein